MFPQGVEADGVLFHPVQKGAFKGGHHQPFFDLKTNSCEIFPIVAEAASPNRTIIIKLDRRA